jgi:multidrug efflux system membrane fusion protein
MAARRRFRWGFALLGVLLIALIVWAVFGHKKPDKAAPPKIPVSVAQVSVQDVPLSIDALGAAQAWQGVLINPQVNGKLIYVAPEGTDVKAGDVLAKIDASTYQAALTQAQGALRRDQALLQGAKVDLARYQTLNAQDSISRQQYEDQAALVKQDEGVVQLDQGAVAAAQVNVNYCTLHAPVSGRVGVRLIDPGNIVSTGTTTGIVSVNQITPIAVTFTVPQGDFQRLSQASNAFSKPLATRALSQETGADLGSGQLSVADNHVDQTTGTVQLKARFENLSKQLWPGQFVNVKLTLQTLPDAVTIPSAAVNQGPKGAYAYVVGADSKAAMRPITVAVNQGNIAVISAGLAKGETVVTDGQMSLKPGSQVAVGHPGAAAASATNASSGKKPAA